MNPPDIESSTDHLPPYVGDKPCYSEQVRETVPWELRDTPPVLHFPHEEKAEMAVEYVREQVVADHCARIRGLVLQALERTPELASIPLRDLVNAFVAPSRWIRR